MWIAGACELESVPNLIDKMVGNWVLVFMEAATDHKLKTIIEKESFTAYI